MKLSPVNIKRQEFTKAVRGYNTVEVNDFLEKVAEEVESVQKENETLRRTVDQLNLDIERYKTIEDSLQKALIAAQESSGLALQKANEEATKIIEDAGKEATTIIGDSQEKAIQLQKHIAELEERMAWLIARLSAMVETQEDLLGLRVKNINKMVETVESENNPDIILTESTLTSTEPEKEPETIVEVIAEVDEVVTEQIEEIVTPEEQELIDVPEKSQETEIKKKEMLSDEEQKRKKLAEMFFTGGAEKIDLNNIVDD